MFNTKFILPGDDKDQIISKINFNFQQILFNGVGYDGPIGNVGPTGISGEVGSDGIFGANGNPATRWFFSGIEPSPSDSRNGDIWVNEGPTGGRDIFVFGPTSWIYSGETLLDDSIFSLVLGISGPGQSSDKNAIEISNSPATTTLVLSDSQSTLNDANPNLAKLLIATDASQQKYPSLTFDKTFYSGSNPPSFLWAGTGPSYDFVFSSPQELKITSGATASFGPTGSLSSIYFFPNQSLRLNSAQNPGQNINLNAPISGGYLLASTASTIQLTSNNINLTPQSLSFQFSAGTGSSVSGTVNTNPILRITNSSSAGSGVKVNLIGSSTDPIVRFTNNLSYRVFESRPDGLNVVGVSGPSGSAFGNFVKMVSFANKVNTSSTFIRNSFTNNLMSLPLTEQSSDLISIQPDLTGPISSDNRIDRIYLQIENFSGIWRGPIAGGRTFDIFLNNNTLCFGGIRSVYPGPSGFTSTSVQILDTGTGINEGCRHIRLQFLSEVQIGYTAFTTYATTSAPRCGFIPYSITRTPSSPTSPI